MPRTLFSLAGFQVITIGRFWVIAEHWVSTVGRDEVVIRDYIRQQEQEDQRLDQINLWR